MSNNNGINVQMNIKIVLFLEPELSDMELTGDITSKKLPMQ
jgi:hypothetical protein